MPGSERDQQAARPAARIAPSAMRPPKRAANPVLARAQAIQRAAGNRAAGRVLSRWTKHPDPEQKGVMVPDSSAGEYSHFNPPKNE